MALSDILRGITKPFRQMGETAAIIQAAYGAGKDPKKMAALRNYDPRFTTVQETERMMEKPGLTALQTGAQAASFLTPGSIGGAGLKGAVKAGAVGGAMGGFGASEAEDFGGMASDTLTGGALGGILGGVGYGVGQGIKKLSTGSAPLDDILLGAQSVEDQLKAVNAGSKLQKRGLIAEAKNTGIWDSTLSETENLKKYLSKRSVLSKVGSNIGTDASTTLQNMDDALSKYTQIKQDALPKINVDNAVLGKIDDKFLSNVGKQVQNVNKGSRAAAFDDVALKFSQARKNPSPQALDELATEFQSLVNYKAQDATIKNASGVYDSAARAIRDTLKKSNPQYNEAMKGLSELLEEGTRKNIGKLASKQTSGFKSAVLTNAEVPFTGTLNQGVNRLQGVGAKVAQGARGLDSELGRNVGQAISNQAGRAGVLGGIDEIFGLSAAEQAAAAGAQSADPLSNILGAGQQPQLDTETMGLFEALGLAQQMFPGASESEALSLAKAIQEDQGSNAGLPDMTDTQRSYFAAQQSALEALKILQLNPSVSGKTQGIQNFFTNLSGGANAATSYESYLTQLRSNLIKAFAGSSVTETELRNLEKSLPKITDSPERAAQKINQLIPTLEQQTRVNSTQLMQPLR